MDAMSMLIKFSFADNAQTKAAASSGKAGITAATQYRTRSAIYNVIISEVFWFYNKKL